MQKPPTLQQEWARHQAPVYNFMRRMGLDPHTAADLSQETILRAIRGSHRFLGEGSPRAWVLGIARNVFREWLRSGRRELPVAEHIDQAGIDDRESRDVGDALALLDPGDREVLVLRFVVGLSSQEVSLALGITDASVRQRVLRAKAAFREVWEAS